MNGYADVAGDDMDPADIDARLPDWHHGHHEVDQCSTLTWLDPADADLVRQREFWT
jgi:hypothetical protein